MKIAVVEWMPRLCGVVSWVKHITAPNDRDVELVPVSCTKSGAPMKAWASTNINWLTLGRYTFGAELRDHGFDAVIYSDVVCKSPLMWDRDDFPLWLDMMKQVDLPWTMMMHDAFFSPKQMLALEETLAVPGFTGKIVTTRHEACSKFMAENYPKTPVQWVVNPFLPYAWSPPKPVNTDPQRGFNFLGRLSPTKGIYALVNIFPELLGDLTLWGFNSYGFPSNGWRMFEQAMDMGYEDLEHPVVNCNRTHPNAKKFYTGRYAVRWKPTGKVLRYAGEYPNLESVDWSPKIGISLTSEMYRGTLEYSTLDQLDNGLVCCVAEHQIAHVANAYPSMVTLPYVNVTFDSNNEWRPRTEQWNREEIIDRLVSLNNTPAMQGLINLGIDQLKEAKKVHSVSRFVQSITEALA